MHAKSKWRKLVGFAVAEAAERPRNIQHCSNGKHIVAARSRSWKKLEAGFGQGKTGQSGLAS